MAAELIGLEEHLVWPAVLDAWSSLAPRWRDLSFDASSRGDSGSRLADVGDRRIAAMDETGLDVQVLSLSTPGLQNLSAHDSVALQSISNDGIAEVVRGTPHRFQGLATLATGAPEHAAAELERAVTVLGLDGAMVFARTRENSADQRDLWPIYEAAAALRAPLYLHPSSPPAAVRTACYTEGLPDAIGTALATHRLGWHYDTGVQVIRMILAGVFDRFPDLQVILGHWGEVVLFYVERLAPLQAIADLPRPILDYFRTQIYVTPSGMQSHRYLSWALELVGVERIMFSTDYPFESASRSGARAFLRAADLDEASRGLIASGNWNALRRGIRR